MFDHLAKGLALALLAGPWAEGEVVARAQEALGRGGPDEGKWLRKVVRLLVGVFPAAPVDREEEVARVIAGDRGFQRAVWRRGLRVRHWLLPASAMVPVEGPPARFAIFPL